MRVKPVIAYGLLIIKVWSIGQTPSEEAKHTIHSTHPRRRTEYKAPSVKLPESFEKIVVHTLTHNFRNATGLVRAPLRLPIKSNYVLVKIIYAGVNARDVNFSSCRYFGGNNNDTAARLPFDAGFEATRIIAVVGESVTDLKVGMQCAFMTFRPSTNINSITKNLLASDFI